MLLEINYISKSFDKIVALHIPHLLMGEKELVGIVGNNGAGKTTLFRLCLDLLLADKGSISIRQQNVKESEEWKKITSAFIDERFLIDFLTPKEYFYFIGDLYNIGKAGIDDRLVDFKSFMGDELLSSKKYIYKLSKGNKQKVGIIGAMITHPELLILDEPFNFLDPSSQIMMKELLQKYNKEYSTTVLLSSHNIQYVSDVCTRIILLEKGTIIRDEQNATPAIKKELEDYFGEFLK